jgi:hypothetical protein
VSEFDHPQPDQPYDELDIADKALIEVIAAEERARALGISAEAEARLEFLRTIASERGTLDDTDFALLKALDDYFESLPAPDFPPGLPPRLRRAVYGEDAAGGTPPPDIP